ncbi:MAG: hypothetical protein EZS28_032127 [Streblomastix strix]|uniref:Tyr recombinase domain-containing protein n=1 Tax=Streblomastix strix TaxID=222440 RepID=A0A5J4UPI5_9EUKA|nr:MAG: hypothetical protein EZS28_032127 [Streblomastix strix]
MRGVNVLAKFLNADDVCKSPIVNSATKGFELAIRRKSKYATKCNLDLLLSYIAEQQKVNGRRLMILTMAMFVAFTVARIKELIRMLIGEIDIDEDKMIIRIKLKKGKKESEFNVEVSRYKGKICPVKEMINWLKNIERIKGKQNSVRYDQIKKSKISPYACSKCLRKIKNEGRIDQQYEGATVRHAMMTKLRKYALTQERVNAFTRYTPGSNVVDVYYNKPIERTEHLVIIM